MGRHEMTQTQMYHPNSPLLKLTESELAEIDSIFAAIRTKASTDPRAVIEKLKEITSDSDS